MTLLYHIGILPWCGRIVPFAVCFCHFHARFCYWCGILVMSVCKHTSKEKIVNKNTDNHKEDEAVVSWPVVFVILALIFAVYNLESFMW